MPSKTEKAASKHFVYEVLFLGEHPKRMPYYIGKHSCGDACRKPGGARMPGSVCGYTGSGVELDLLKKKFPLDQFRMRVLGFHGSPAENEQAESRALSRLDLSDPDCLNKAGASSKASDGEVADRVQTTSRHTVASLRQMERQVRGLERRLEAARAESQTFRGAGMAKDEQLAAQEKQLQMYRALVEEGQTLDTKKAIAQLEKRLLPPEHEWRQREWRERERELQAQVSSWQGRYKEADGLRSKLLIRCESLERLLHHAGVSSQQIGQASAEKRLTAAANRREKGKAFQAEYQSGHGMYKDADNARAQLLVRCQGLERLLRSRGMTKQQIEEALKR